MMMNLFNAAWNAWRTLDTGAQIFICAVVGYVAMFHVLMPAYRTPKQRSWILTCMGSLAMTIASVPFLMDFIIKRGDVSTLKEIRWWSEGACRIFQAYLISDLVMGAIYYRKHVSLLMGWFHHTAYIALTQLVVSWQWSHILMLAAVMEFPTFLLSIASLHPSLRHDILFATTFFSTRILFHVALFISYLVPSTRKAAVQGSYWPAALFATAFPMHVVWFAGCINGFRKRARATAAINASNALPTTTEISQKTPLLSSTTTTSSVPITYSISAPAPYSDTAKLYPPSTVTLPTTPHRPLSTRIMVSSSSTPILATPHRPPMAPRRRSLLSADREEAIRRLARAVAEAFPPAGRAPAAAARIGRRVKAYATNGLGLGLGAGEARGVAVY